MRTTMLGVAALVMLAACGGSDASEEGTAPSLASLDGEAAQTAAPSNTAPAEEPAETISEPEGSLATEDMVLGSDDAPVTVTEYASVTCPHCATFHTQFLPVIKEELIDTGQVRFVFREFPTSPVQLSYIGSILARCSATEAGAPGYYTMLSALYQRQSDWAYSAEPAVALEEIFSQVGLDRAAMEQCLRREAIIEKINANVKAGQEAGVQGTPTLLIDGERFEFGRTPEETVEKLRAIVAERS
ncbi:DsbA family protein [Parvularcula dongshanensis]|uniref:Protein-disulfide isomerase n=1 Tax=Parvularcula dongshanensis TaxID=1173995 RepID=A0A840I3J0_9PROT|nr:DsbA family protein [Parvularcula dongshanensis]MBB4658610.1 protein-disulfide isomerase [Parvularcula dongshanensis]